MNWYFLAYKLFQEDVSYIVNEILTDSWSKQGNFNICMH